MNNTPLQQRQFYQRLTPRVCVAIMIFLALIGGAVCFAVWAQHAALQGSDFSISLVRGAGFGALGGVCVIAIPLLWRILGRPILILDEVGLRIGNVKLHWEVISEVYPTRYRGEPLVAVRTLNDDNALRRLPKWLAVIMNARRRSTGALFAVPEARALDTNELIELIRTYQAAALESKQREVHEASVR